MTNTLIDVVYPIAGGTQGRKSIGSRWDNNELRYSLRSLEKNFPNLGRVFIVGYKPEWLTGVTHIPAEDIHHKNKDANLIDKVLLACNADVSETFVRLSDDQCLLRPWGGGEAYHAGSADVNRKGRWWRRMARTCDHLKAMGLPTHYYETHSPQPVNREEFKLVMGAVDYQTPPGMNINTLYFNSVDIPRHSIKGKKASFHNPATIEAIRKGSEGRVFFGYSEAGTTDVLKGFLEEQFPTPSRFELPVTSTAPPVKKKRKGTPVSLTSDAVQAFLNVLPEGGTILELGSGKSTTTFCDSGRRVVTVEHSEKYLGRCKDAEYVFAPMVEGFYGQDHFLRAAGLALRNGNLRGVVVDGPPKKHGAHRSLLAEYLALFKGFPFLIDDTNRRSERNLVNMMSERGWKVGVTGGTGGKKWAIMMPTNS